MTVYKETKLRRAFNFWRSDAAIKSLKDSWENVPSNWDGSDPCGDHWDGIGCHGSNVVSLTLSSMNLNGQLSRDIGGLSELQNLDLSYNKGLTGSLPREIGNLTKLSNLNLVGCGFSGQIPDTIGSLSKLKFLSLNVNKFFGPIPPSLGKLSELYWLDLADNMLTGSIPVSDGSTPGLDMLVEAQHFHFGRNNFSGEIPSQLFSSNMKLKHLLLEQNQFTGSIPETLELVRSLTFVNLDGNLLSGSVPSNLNNLSSINELHLSNNNLNGPFPNLTGLNGIHYVDLSNNTFNPTDFPSWFSTLQNLTTLVLDGTGLQGPIPASLFGLYQLQNVIMRNNKLNGTLSIGPNYSSQLRLVDLQNNFIESFPQGPAYQFQTSLVSNPICFEGNSASYCAIPREYNSSYSTPPTNCSPSPCSSDQTSSPTCACAYPYTGYILFRTPSFSDLANSSEFVALQDSMMQSFKSLQLPVDSVSLSNPTKNLDYYLVLYVQVFPNGQNHFNQTGVSALGFLLSYQNFKPPESFGPFIFIADNYKFLNGLSKSLSTGIIIGAAVGGSVLVILSLIIGVYAFYQKRRAQEAVKKIDPFASWDRSKSSGTVPQLQGTKCFTFEEVVKCTNNFSEAIGVGGFGNVYKGTLSNGQMVAIKRSLQGSMQGPPEFKSEIELLSRVHHKNVVGLVGFCFDQNEHVLIYEFMPNGTLRESLSGKSGIKLDWMRRLTIALGAAKGLQYLHDLVNPPIIHRDIKTNNILLDENLNAKVADFGLSKSLNEHESTHVTTQIKGTMGYLDPEYYLTNQLTDKSDVYSFGVVLLEIITARCPIEKGKYIVREVKEAMDKTKDMYSLHGFLDSSIHSSTTPPSIEKFVDVALRCVEGTALKRPTMGEVVKEIESIIEMVGLNHNAESASTSDTYSGVSKSSGHLYSDESLFVYTRVQPK
ncbi:probable leucine-rich repeat receptor-like protein kinase At5g49770 isoform X2 [Ipomoea triloba]|uniref:probable leucine-rich repeat receptor-like protein kinase At5g49770 isoform X2 n=1 Tax=Ipomoea triloba TaxID=35885 RepID=UPI00125E4131|nr:probable leucine-rich repeat receptor-like protein kinase At5g49770 isoform X2 [Ipomoea triloba]